MFRKIDRLRELLKQYHYQFLATIGSIILFFSNLFFSPNDGFYMVVTLMIILIEVIVGSLFLLFNTTTLVLVLIFQDPLSGLEKKWAQDKIKKNTLVIFTWLFFSVASFVIVAPNLGIIASLYLLSLIFVFHFAGTEENPFLEQTYHRYY